jgi:5-bromo-4-chloroindolyl phosphate hydrolysis protein
MDEVLHANIFFFITGIAVIVFTALLCVLIFHAIKAFKILERILLRIEEGTEVIAEDMQSLRAYFTDEGFFGRLIATLLGSRKSKESRAEKSKKQEKKKSDLKVMDEI